MQHGWTGKAAASLAALGVALSCAGCSVGPVDLDDFLMDTSVADARAARVAELSPAVDASALKRADTLTVGILGTQTAPLSVTSSDGARSGMDLDTAHALADQLGLPAVSFVTVTDVSDALSESCDVVMGVTAETADGAAVVGDYAQQATGVFCAQGVSAPVDASALSGASVGVQDGSVSQRVLADLGIEVSQATFPNLNEAFDALEDGSVAYVVCDAYSGAYLATAYDGVSLAGTLDSPVPVGVAVSSEALQGPVQSALDAVQSNGVGGLVRARWVGELPALTDALRVTGLPATADGDAAGDDATVLYTAGDGDATPDASGDAAAPDAAADTTPAE